MREFSKKEEKRTLDLWWICLDEEYSLNVELGRWGWGAFCFDFVMFCIETPFFVLSWIEIFGVGWVDLEWVLFCLYGLNQFRVELDWDLGSWVVLFFFLDLLCVSCCARSGSPFDWRKVSARDWWRRWWWEKLASMKWDALLGKALLPRWNLHRIRKLGRVLPWRYWTRRQSSSTKW